MTLMEPLRPIRTRRVIRWPKEAADLIGKYLKANSNGHPRNKNAVASLATKLVILTGNPRDACLRYLHQQGVTHKRYWRAWTKTEQQKLLNLIEISPIEEIARTLRRSPCSIRSMLHRLGETSKRGRDWFTPYSLAEALHVGVAEVQRWIANGWLKCRTVEVTGLQKRIIDPDDFSEFVKKHGPSVVGRRLSADGLRFVQNFVFPPKHACLLPLRKSKDMPDEAIESGEADQFDIGETA